MGATTNEGFTLSHLCRGPNRSGAGALELPVIEWVCDWCRGGDIWDGAMVANGCNVGRVSVALIWGSDIECTMFILSTVK
jgi:hypothetical protein